jgi:hypothetical protein
MKRLIALSLLAAPVAQAHTLDPAGGVFTALVHELLGWHHLPLTLLLVVAGIVLFRAWKKRTS